MAGNPAFQNPSEGFYEGWMLTRAENEMGILSWKKGNASRLRVPKHELKWYSQQMARSGTAVLPTLAQLKPAARTCIQRFAEQRPPPGVDSEWCIVYVKPEEKSVRVARGGKWYKEKHEEIMVVLKSEPRPYGNPHSQKLAGGKADKGPAKLQQGPNFNEQPQFNAGPKGAPQFQPGQAEAMPNGPKPQQQNNNDRAPPPPQNLGFGGPVPQGSGIPAGIQIIDVNDVQPKKGPGPPRVENFDQRERGPSGPTYAKATMGGPAIPPPPMGDHNSRPPIPPPAPEINVNRSRDPRRAGSQRGRRSIAYEDEGRDPRHQHRQDRRSNTYRGIAPDNRRALQEFGAVEYDRSSDPDSDFDSFGSFTGHPQQRKNEQYQPPIHIHVHRDDLLTESPPYKARHRDMGNSHYHHRGRRSSSVSPGSSPIKERFLPGYSFPRRRRISHADDEYDDEVHLDEYTLEQLKQLRLDREWREEQSKRAEVARAERKELDDRLAYEATRSLFGNRAAQRHSGPPIEYFYPSEYRGRR